MNALKTVFSIVSLICFTWSSLNAETYLVGTGKTYETLQDIADMLKPGDVVLVDGNTTYPSGVYLEQSGNSDSFITIRGIKPSGGTRPVISGEDMYGINVSGDYVIVENFQVSGLPKGIGVFGNNIKIRGCIINDCNHGLIGYGTGTGNVTVEYCEFYGNGVPTGGATQHQIYMATDEILHPGATFRLQYCFLHDAVEGDNVKSRAGRNEIYFNWIENAGTSGHGLGLFAPDPDDNSDVNVNTAREDADVVGNVIIQQRNSCARIGGDLPGNPTNGRYRFVNNTFILAGTRGDVIRTFNTIETLEMYNNVIYSLTSGADIRVVNDADGQWLHSPRSLTGSNNWVITSATMVPDESEWSSTIKSSASPFVNTADLDFHPGSGSGLINAGTTSTPSLSLYPFPDPLFPPAFQPPRAELIDTGSAESRPADETIDIGAFEDSSMPTINSRSRNYFQAISVLKSSGSAVKAYRINGSVVRKPLHAGSGLRVIKFGRTGVSSPSLLFTK